MHNFIALVKGKWDGSHQRQLCSLIRIKPDNISSSSFFFSTFFFLTFFLHNDTLSEAGKNESISQGTVSNRKGIRETNFRVHHSILVSLSCVL